MLNVKIQTMERICKDNIEAHGKKYSALLDKLESLTVKTSSVKHENAVIRANIKHINHVTTLEKEPLKAETTQNVGYSNNSVIHKVKPS